MKLLRGKLTRLFTRAEPGTLLTNLSQNEYYHSFIIRFLHMSTSIKKMQYLTYRRHPITFPILLIDLMKSLYSHIALCGIFSVQQRLNGSPFDRETPLN